MRKGSLIYREGKCKFIGLEGANVTKYVSDYSNGRLSYAAE